MDDECSRRLTTVHTPEFAQIVGEKYFSPIVLNAKARAVKFLKLCFALFIIGKQRALSGAREG